MGEKEKAEDIKKKTDDFRKKHIPLPRSVYNEDRWSQDTLGALNRQKKIKGLTIKDRQRRPGSVRPPKPGSRSNF